MTDLQRLLAFLTGMDATFPHEVRTAADVMTLPMDPAQISFIRYATKVSTGFFVCYFADDGHFVGMSRPGSWADQ